MRVFTVALAAPLAFICLFTAGAAEPAAVPAEPSYFKNVLPILRAKNCTGCHQPAKQGGDYVMTEFAALLKGGESGSAAIVPGKPDKSYLIEQIVPVDGKASMPKDAGPLTEVEIATIRKWIERGARHSRQQPTAIRCRSSPRLSRSSCSEID